MNLTPLQRHIQNQQDMAGKLAAVLEALETLNVDGVADNAQTVLIGVARSMAEELNANLDSTAVPKEGAA